MTSASGSSSAPAWRAAGWRAALWRRRRPGGIDPAALTPPPRIDSASRIDPAVLAVAQDPESSPTERLAACREMLRFGNIAEAVAAVSMLHDAPGLRDEVAEILAQIRTVRRLGIGQVAAPPPAADEVGGDADRAYWVVPGDSDTTLIAFTGQAKRLDISVYFMQRLLGRHGMNVIYVFDWNDAYYFGGVKGLGAGIDETVTALAGLCRSLGSRRVLCFGQSSGGYAAIYYGARIGADGVLAFSPVIRSPMTEPGLSRIGRRTGVAVRRRDADLRRLLGAESDPPRVRIVHGGRNRGDRRSARRLEGLPNVTVQVLPGVRTHGTVEVTALAGTFDGILRAFCEDVGPGAWRGLKTGRRRARRK